ncbi:hypothetical protein RRG08_008305 [Elysia crispata]|uniref:Secreted protein n=1 Tax=Elysia crispata TaxID=231223 RepID=A0AAE1DIT5_9GAST|nr:hypothetical protein RRG08_008305 [Elysia crispata]
MRSSLSFLLLPNFVHTISTQSLHILPNSLHIHRTRLSLSQYVINDRDNHLRLLPSELLTRANANVSLVSGQAPQTD